MPLGLDPQLCIFIDPHTEPVKVSRETLDVGATNQAQSYRTRPVRKVDPWIQSGYIDSSTPGGFSVNLQVSECLVICGCRPGLKRIG